MQVESLRVQRFVDSLPPMEETTSIYQSWIANNMLWSALYSHTLTDINWDCMSNTSSGLWIILHYAGPLFRILGCNNDNSVGFARSCSLQINKYKVLSGRIQRRWHASHWEPCNYFFYDCFCWLLEAVGYLLRCIKAWLPEVPQNFSWILSVIFLVIFTKLFKILTSNFQRW